MKGMISRGCLIFLIHNNYLYSKGVQTFKILRFVIPEKPMTKTFICITWE